MTRAATEDEIFDHERDHRKHETTRAAGFSALEIAIIVKGLKSLEDGAALIDQYARTVASGARLQAVVDTCDRIVEDLDHEIGASA